MGQVLHGSATTTPAIRAAIQPYYARISPPWFTLTAPARPSIGWRLAETCAAWTAPSNQLRAALRISTEAGPLTTTRRMRVDCWRDPTMRKRLGGDRTE